MRLEGGDPVVEGLLCCVVGTICGREFWPGIRIELVQGGCRGGLSCQERKPWEVEVLADSRMGQFRGFLVEMGKYKLFATRSHVPWR
jgi:hypothetical protein